VQLVFPQWQFQLSSPLSIHDPRQKLRHYPNAFDWQNFALYTTAEFIADSSLFVT
jgi:hypothetical protein